jgi:hypothetical protein
MASGNDCKVKDDLENQISTLNNNLNTLSPAWLYTQRAAVQERHESPYVEIKRNRGDATQRQTLSCRPAPALQFKHQVRLSKSLHEKAG